MTKIYQPEYDEEMLDALLGTLDLCPAPESKVSFIENKNVDYHLLRKILGLSQKLNHWANFGPVSVLLESYLHKKMGIAEDKSVVVCKSGTTALHSLVCLHEKKNGGAMRWVISAFGFIASNIGPLASSKIIDCDRQGMLSLAELKKLDLASWDGVIVTNVFGLCKDITQYQQYCSKHGKVLIMDAATALLTPSRHIPQAPVEAVSFHQTKPWGMGEGGCAIVDRVDEKEFRALINYGAGCQSDEREYVVNGKLSDFCSALILHRILAMPSWQPLYQEQSERIQTLALECNLLPLAPIDDNTIMAHIPVLAEAETSKRDIRNPYFTIRKYYRSLSSESIQASNIYNKILNIPCHSQMATLSDQIILEVLSGIGLSTEKAPV